MNLRVVSSAFVGLLVMSTAACGGSTEGQSAEPAYESVSEACGDLVIALDKFPSDAPAMTSTGLSEWADQAQVVADEFYVIAQRLEPIDAMAYSVVQSVADSAQESIDRTRVTAEDPSETNIVEMSDAVVEASDELRGLSTICQ